MRKIKAVRREVPQTATTLLCLAAQGLPSWLRVDGVLFSRALQGQPSPAGHSTPLLPSQVVIFCVMLLMFQTLLGLSQQYTNALLFSQIQKQNPPF